MPGCEETLPRSIGLFSRMVMVHWREKNVDICHMTERLLLPLPLAAHSLTARMCFESSSLGISRIMLNWASKPQRAAACVCQPWPLWLVQVTSNLLRQIVPALRCPRLPTGSCFWVDPVLLVLLLVLAQGMSLPKPFWGYLGFEMHLC